MLDSLDLEARIREILDAHRGMEGPLLPILHAVQEAFGHVPEAALPIIAADLNISKAEAHGVMTFYHDFRARPAGRHVLKLCRAEACQSMGADALADQVKAKLGLDWHETSRDGAITLTYAPGQAPLVQRARVDDRRYWRVRLADDLNEAGVENRDADAAGEPGARPAPKPAGKPATAPSSRRRLPRPRRAPGRPPASTGTP